MTIKYIPFDDAQAMDAKIAEINTAYFADMRARLGRAPGETIDSVVDPNTGAILRPADRVITTALVEPKTFAGVAGGLVPVDDTVRTYDKAVDLSAQKDVAQLDKKWTDAIAAEAVAADAVAAADAAAGVDP